MDLGGVAPGTTVVHHAGEQSSHLSDVVEVITADDPTFCDGAAPPSATMQAPAPYVFIVEQPSPKSLRFRYECEGRSAGSIPGVNSTPENKTFPTIKVCGYKGCMVIVVSCVTKDEPYKPHPHNLVGRDCQMGVCTVKVKTDGDADSCQVQFKNLGIQCVKRRDIAEALRVRQDLRVNPFKTGYRSQPQSIDLNAVRLCFQVFLTDDSYKVQRALQPVVSEVVYDKKAMSDLLIVRSSHCSGPMRGGTTVILLCEKVTREDTEVWFYHEDNGVTVWSERVPPEFVHKQLAVVFKTPPYVNQRLPHHITVNFRLHRVSDNAKSNVYNFEYIPEGQDIESILSPKRRKTPSCHLQEYDERSLSDLPIKSEPRDRTPPHTMSNPAYADQQWAVAGSSQMGGWYPPADRYLHVQQPQQNVQGMQMHHMQVPQRSPMGHGSPLGHGSPMGHVSPLGHASPIAQQSPMAQQCLSPMGQQCVSPMAQKCVSPMGQQCASPMAQQCVSPISQCMSPGHGAVSPNMMQMQGMQPMQNLQTMQPMQPMQGGMQGIVHMAGSMDPVMGEVQQPTYTQMDSTVNSTPSLSTLLMNPGDEEAGFYSADLSNLSSILGPGDLSDSLNRLSTRDLLQP